MLWVRYLNRAELNLEHEYVINCTVQRLKIIYNVLLQYLFTKHICHILTFYRFFYKKIIISVTKVFFRALAIAMGGVPSLILLLYIFTVIILFARGSCHPHFLYYSARFLVFLH